MSTIETSTKHVPDMIAAPIGEAARVESMDVLRGFALLGILVPNIVFFAWPQVAVMDPGFMGESTANDLGYRITGMFFLGKMMMLFAMLFGGGVIFFARRYDKPVNVCFNCGYSLAELGNTVTCPECGLDKARLLPKLSKGAGRWYIRLAWLLGIGLLHAYGLWYGDILVWYAVVGATLVWWVRRLKPMTLFLAGGITYAIGAMLMLGLSGLMIWAMQAGHVEQDMMMADPAPEVRAYQGGYGGIFVLRAITVLGMHFFLLPFLFPSIAGLMLLGMALVKSGVFTGERSVRFYTAMALGGVLGGGLLTAFVYTAIERSGLAVPGLLWQFIAQPVGIPLGLGYAGALLLIVRTGMLAPVRAALAAVGRMALTNYLMQTILCTTLFYGYGVSRFLNEPLFASVEYPHLFGIIAGVWVINITFSLLWQRWFIYGPVEWLWRSLTYLRVQPLVRRAERSAAGR